MEDSMYKREGRENALEQHGRVAWRRGTLERKDGPATEVRG
jgi:hypothetical protein